MRYTCRALCDVTYSMTALNSLVFFGMSFRASGLQMEIVLGTLTLYKYQSISFSLTNKYE